MELVFALEFRGKGVPVPGVEGAREAHTTAPIAGLTAYVGGEWLRPRMQPGEMATLRARVRRFADGTFVEEGRIVYGDAGAVAFDTVGRGWVGRRPGATAMFGAVVWRITQGEGGFADVQGMITSNFSVTDDGAVVDHHVVRMYLPSTHRRSEPQSLDSRAGDA